jgi:hypothetical protein
LQRANTIGKVGVRKQPLLDVFNNKVWIFFWRKTTKIYRVSTKVLNKSNPIHGGGNTDMHRINQG